MEMLALDPLQPTSNRRVFDVHLDAPHSHTLMSNIADLEELARTGHTKDVISLLRAMTAADFVESGSSVVLEEKDVTQASSWS